MPTPSLLTEAEVISFTIFLVLILLLGFFGNATVCLAIYYDYRLHQQVANIFIFNLAVTDFITVVLVIPFCIAAIIQGGWSFGKLWCQATAFLYYTLAIIALETLSLISLDRFYAIVRPLRYRMLITAPRAKLMLSISWVWASVFTIPCAVLGWFQYGRYESMCTYNFSGSGDQWKLRVMVYCAVTILLCIVVPFSVLLVCYVRIFRVVKLQSNRVVPQVNPAIAGSNVRFKRNVGIYKGCRIIVLVVLLFLLSWTPFSITRLIKTISWNHEMVPAGVDTFSTILSFLSAATNPILYGLCRKDFRRAFRKLYRQVRSGCIGSGEKAGKREEKRITFTNMPLELLSV